MNHLVGFSFLANKLVQWQVSFNISHEAAQDQQGHQFEKLNIFGTFVFYFFLIPDFRDCITNDFAAPLLE